MVRAMLPPPSDAANAYAASLAALANARKVEATSTAWGQIVETSRETTRPPSRPAL